MVNNGYDGMRITNNNLQDYLNPKPTENSIVLIKRHIIPSHNYLLNEKLTKQVAEPDLPDTNDDDLDV